MTAGIEIRDAAGVLRFSTNDLAARIIGTWEFSHASLLSAGVLYLDHPSFKDGRIWFIGPTLAVNFEIEPTRIKATPTFYTPSTGTAMIKYGVY